MVFAKTHYRRLDTAKIKQAGLTMDNSRCHLNAVAAVRGGRADKAWLCVAGNDSEGCIHFINSKDGVFFDETWHEYDNSWHYYLIRQVDESEFGDIADVLYCAKESFVLTVGTWLERRKFYKDRSSVSI